MPQRVMHSGLSAPTYGRPRRRVLTREEIEARRLKLAQDAQTSREKETVFLTRNAREQADLQRQHATTMANTAGQQAATMQRSRLVADLARGGMTGPDILKVLGSGDGGGVSTPRQNRQLRTQQVLDQSKIANAAYDAKTAQAIKDEGRVPSMTFQAPGGPERTLRGRETQLAEGASGAIPTPANTYGQLAGMHADVARQYGPGGTDIYNAYSGPNVKGLNELRQAMRQQMEPMAGPELTPGQYEHVRGAMEPRTREAAAVEGPTGPGGPTVSNEVDQQRLKEIEGILSKASPTNRADWGMEWAFARKIPDPKKRQTEQDRLALELHRQLPDDNQRNFYLKAKNITLPKLAGEEEPASQPTSQPAAPAPTAQPAGAPVPVVPGNIDVANLPIVKNADGSVSTVRSIGIEEDGLQVVIPTVFDGKVHSWKEAVDHYRKTKQHLGKFNTIDEAGTFAEQLHQDEEKRYKGQPTPAPTAQPAEPQRQPRPQPGPEAVVPTQIPGYNEALPARTRAMPIPTPDQERQQYEQELDRQIAQAEEVMRGRSVTGAAPAGGLASFEGDPYTRQKRQQELESGQQALDIGKLQLQKGQKELAAPTEGEQQTNTAALATLPVADRPGVFGGMPAPEAVQDMSVSVIDRLTKTVNPQERMRLAVAIAGEDWFQEWEEKIPELLASRGLTDPIVAALISMRNAVRDAQGLPKPPAPVAGAPAPGVSPSRPFPVVSNAYSWGNWGSAARGARQ
ncbi:MAG TPA: hypothetical protein VNA25_19885 [Phycisphaerae bacterium]|nr:hypothetical protein [Phycisphaerae bacterium]